jgi:membrane-associated phospholipid phosphatase
LRQTEQHLEAVMTAAISTAESEQKRSWRRWTWRRRLDRRAKFLMLAVAILLCLFGVMAFTLRRADGTALDVAITRWVQTLDGPGFTELMIGVSAIGYGPWTDVFVVSAVMACLAARWYCEALLVVASSGAGWIAANIKLLVERPRPTSPLVQVLGHLADTSYPSGHVTSYVVLYGLLFFLVFVRMGRGWLRTLLLIGLGALVGLVGVSRIYLGHHWASDVMGGYALGGAYLLLLLVVYRWLLLPDASPPEAAAAPARRGVS